MAAYGVTGTLSAGAGRGHLRHFRPDGYRLGRLRPHFGLHAGGPGAGRPALRGQPGGAGGAVYHLRCPTAGPTSGSEKSEDQQLAREVEGIDLILSGHTHTTLTQPIVEGDTYIVSAGPYCENLGSITLEWDGGREQDPGGLPADPHRRDPAGGPGDRLPGGGVEAPRWGWIYLARYHLTYDQVLTTGGLLT